MPSLYRPLSRIFDRRNNWLAACVLGLLFLTQACVRPAPPPSALVSVRIAPRAPTQGKPPLLVLLHGYGTDEHDLLSLAARLDPRFDVRSVRAPLTLAPGRYAWYRPPGGGVLLSLDRLVRFIGEAVAADHADPSRVYLAGFSQGAVMAVSVALTAPRLVAGAVVMSGRILPQVEARRASPAALRGLPLLVEHGTEDPRIPVVNARAMREELSKLPVALTYREFPMAHQITPESLAVAAGWLTRQLDAPRHL